MVKPNKKASSHSTPGSRHKLSVPIVRLKAYAEVH